MPLLFAVTLFVSAFLLFLVQPLVGKLVLPLLGGTPAVWNTCMVFFQAALLAGYAYTHTVSTRLALRRQLLLQGAILVLPFLFLPFAVGAWEPPTDSDPVFSVLGLLTLMVGVPFFVVATSAPLLQKWFTATGHPTAKDPYFLYGASNLGSMLALLAYPVVFEPRFPLAEQSWLWAGTYGAFLALTLVCAATVWFAPPVVQLPAVTPAPGEPVPPAPPAVAEASVRVTPKGWKQRRAAPAAVTAPSVKPAAPAGVTALRRLRWIGLAAAPSSLMLGVTTYLTTDIAAIPLFWIVPLALYLLSFICVFMRWPVEWSGTPHRVVLVVQPLALAVLVVFNLVDVVPPHGIAFAVHLGAFFLTALLCHGELARDRPATRYLTEFYLCMSLGGVLGGLLNGLVAPVVFNRVFEYMLVLALSCLLRPPLSVLAALRGGVARSPTRDDLSDDPVAYERTEKYLDVGYAVCLGLLTYALARLAVARNLWGAGKSLYTYVHLQIRDLGVAPSASETAAAWASTALVAAVPIMVCLVFSSRPLRFGLCALAFFLANGLYAVANDDSLYVHRNFFGVIRVRPGVDADHNVVMHTLVHGGIDHGSQYISGPKRAQPITYFHPTGPVGRVFTAFSDQKEAPPFAVVGLGIGTLAAYARPDQVVHYYEIDPAVKHLSLPPEGETAYFFYLQDALKRGAKLDVILGDGRLRLKEARPDYYQIIVVDAFSSDAIPVHLLTLEAVEVYLSKMVEGGVLIFNITNRYVDLRQPLANVAARKGLACYYGGDYHDRRIPDKNPADWVVMVKPRSPAARAAEAQELARERALRLVGAGPAGAGLAAVPWAGLVEEAPTGLRPWLRAVDLPGSWVRLAPNNARVWTDDYSNLLGVMHLFGERNDE